VLAEAFGFRELVQDCKRLLPGDHRRLDLPHGRLEFKREKAQEQ